MISFHGWLESEIFAAFSAVLHNIPGCREKTINVFAAFPPPFDSILVVVRLQFAQAIDFLCLGKARAWLAASPVRTW